MKDISRRSFLKGAATVGGALTVGGTIVGTAFASEGSAGSASGSAAGSAAGPSWVSTCEVEPAVSGYVCGEDWLGEAPVIDAADIVETVDADVVVCGSGHSGTQCALAAAQAGAKVVVLEAQARDSYVCFGDDICSYNSQFLTDRGFGGYDLGEIVAEYIRRGAGRVSPEIIRKFVENSGEMMDNLVSIVPDTSNVFDFDNYQCQVQTAYEMPDASYYPLERGGFKAWATTVQTIGTKNPTHVSDRTDDVSRLTELELYSRDAAEALGATWCYETSAVVLVQNDAGDVTGVIAQDADGAYHQYNAAKAVCLCCGDFSGNPDMIWNLLDDVDEIGARNGMDRAAMRGAGRDGSGHKMGCWAGGNIECHPRPSMNTMGGNPGPWGTTPFLLINANGDRFVNECMAGFVKPIVQRQPHGNIAAICDANWMTSVQNAGLDHGAPNWGAAGVDGLGVMDNLKTQMDAAAGTGADGADVGGVAIINVSMQMGSTVYSGDTLDELLGYLGYEGDAKTEALATIDAYNEMCHNGVDTLYGKDAIALTPIETAPFYGAVSSNDGTGSAGLVTLAGLVTDGDFNVLKPDYTTPIKGLYAAGNCLGHRFGPGYATPSAGASMGMAFTTGRVLGKHVASL